MHNRARKTNCETAFGRNRVTGADILIMGFNLSNFLALIASFIAALLEPKTWIDNDEGNVISFDGDLGWKIWECDGTNSRGCESMTPHCDDTNSNCKREDNSGKVYYGPFNNAIDDSKWMMRRFACAYVN